MTKRHLKTNIKLTLMRQYCLPFHSVSRIHFSLMIGAACLSSKTEIFFSLQLKSLCIYEGIFRVYSVKPWFFFSNNRRWTPWLKLQSQRSLPKASVPHGGVKLVLASDPYWQTNCLATEPGANPEGNRIQRKTESRGAYLMEWMVVEEVIEAGRQAGSRPGKVWFRAKECGHYLAARGDPLKGFQCEENIWYLKIISDCVLKFWSKRVREEVA